MSTTQHYRHCQLCQHQVATFDRGLICGITQEKPAFTEKCSTMSLDKEAIHDAIELDEAISVVKSKRINTYIGTAGAFLLGIVMITVGILMLLHISSRYYLLPRRVAKWGIVGPFIIIGGGIGPIFYAVHRYTKFRQELYGLRRKHQDMTEIIALYTSGKPELFV